MRMTQYVGLTDEAKDFVKEMERSSASPNNDGMFDENVPYSVFTDRHGNVFTEVFQCSPWSSGPMIFTCLQDQNGDKYFRWTLGTPEDREYDPRTGKYYI